MTTHDGPVPDRAIDHIAELNDTIAGQSAVIETLTAHITDLRTALAHASRMQELPLVASA